jgi:mycothiol S-conjugate amidase
MVVSCTGGERGDILNETLAERVRAERDLPGLRRIEMSRAQELLDIEHRWLGFEDSGLPGEGETVPPNSFAAIPVEISAEPLVHIIREYRPHVLVTYDENGGYPHPDHIRTHEISMFAMAAAADPTQFPDAGPAWKVSKLYFERIFNSSRMNSVYNLLVEREPEHPLLARLTEIRGWMSERPDLATTHVPSHEFFEVRDEALLAHSSQVSPDSSFFFWPNDLQREAWATEDFQLVESHVDSTVPEDDLFAGVGHDEKDHS